MLCERRLCSVGHNGGRSHKQQVCRGRAERLPAEGRPFSEYGALDPLDDLRRHFPLQAPAISSMQRPTPHSLAPTSEVSINDQVPPKPFVCIRQVCGSHTNLVEEMLVPHHLPRNTGSRFST